MKAIGGSAICIRELRGNSIIFTKLWYYSLATFRILRDNRPDLVVAQNPPTVCPIIVYLIMRLVNPNGILIVDSHALAIEMGTRSPLWKILSIFERLIIKKSSLATVTHELYLDYIIPLGVRTLVFYDQILDQTYESKKKSYDFICPLGDHDDEDLNQLHKAAHRFNELKFIVTGKSRPPSNLPHNVKYTGFLPKKDYIKALNSSRLGLCPFIDNPLSYPRVVVDFISTDLPFFASQNKILDKIVPHEFLYKNTSQLIEKIEKLDQPEYENRLKFKLRELKKGYRKKTIETSKQLQEIVTGLT